VLQLSHDAINVLPSLLVIQVRRMLNKMSRGAKRKRVGLVEAMTANAARVMARRLVTSFGLLAVATLPARLGRGSVKGEHA
jgi:hypothetical protein